MKKKGNWLIVILCILIIALIIYGIVRYFVNKNDTSILSTEQIVQDIRFSDVNIEKNGNKFTFQVTLFADKDITIESFDAEIKNKKGDTLDTLSGFVGNLTAGETKVVDIETNKDISKAYQVSYSIFKE